MKTLVITDRGVESAQPAQAAHIKAISSLMNDLMERAQAGDIEIGMNALLGAYVNVALKTGRGRNAATALNAAAEAALRIVSGGASQATVDPKDSDGITDLINRVSQVLHGQRHEVCISVLLSLFRSGALQYSCCTESAAEQCAQVAHELKAAATGARSSGDALH